MKKINTIYSLLFLSSIQAIAEENLSVGVIVPSKENFKNEISLSGKEFGEVLGEDYKVNPDIREYSNLEELKEVYEELSKNNNFILSLDPVSSDYLSDTYDNDKLLTPFSDSSSLIIEGAQRFKQIYPFNTLTLLTTKDVNVEEIVSSIESSINTDITVAYIEDLNPIETDAILLYNPSKRDEEAVSSFVRDNLDLGKPTFSVMSKDYVDGGALAGIISGENTTRILREAALDLEEELLNSDLPKDFEDESQVMNNKILFNLNSSKKLGIYPAREVLNNSIFVGSYLSGEETLNFKRAVDIALDNNLTLKSQSYNLDAFSFNPQRVRSNARPNIDAFGQYTNQNDVYTKNSTLDAENTLRGGLKATQTLFSDDLFRDIAVQEKAYEAEKENYRRNEADTVFGAGASYLNILSAEASLNIKKYNLELTREFLEIAKNRKNVGISDSSDVFRLESLYATSLTEVRRDTGRLENSQRALNQSLNLPLETKFDYSPMSLNDDIFLSSNPDFLEILENPIKLQEFIEFFIGQNIDNVPEVRSTDFLIEGKEREYKTAARRRFTPSVALEANAAWDMADPWGENDQGKGKEDYWQLGVGFELPLYSGGDIEYEKKQVSSELKALESDRDAIREEFGVIISSRVTDLSVGYETIKNAQKSTVASEKNLELVRDNYAKGTVSITNLLDAQRDAVTSRQEEVIATYSFLIAILDLERTIGSYYFTEGGLSKEAIDNKIQSINSIGGTNEN